MKKFLKTTLFPLLLCVVLAFACVGCDFGSYTEVGGKPNVNDPEQNEPGGDDNPGTDPSGGDDDPKVDLDYKVTLLVENAVYYFGDTDMKVEWVNTKNSKQRYTAAVDQDGGANAGELADGDYKVHILNLPATFTYNPNSSDNVTSPAKRHIFINLQYPAKPSSGDGTGWVSLAYKIVSIGIYRAVIEQPNQEVHYAFTPTPEMGENGGYYAIRSVCDVYLDEVDPVFRQYNGNSGGWMGGVLVTKSSGGPEGSYTKNFMFGIPMTQQYIGNTIFFTISATQKYGDYPITVDFQLAREGDATEDVEYKTIPAAQATREALDSTLPYHYANEASPYYRTFDFTKFKYNSRSRYYHRYDAELYKNDPLGYGEGFGPILYCDIEKAPPSFPQYALIRADAVPIGSMGSNRNLLELTAEFMGVTYNESKYDEDYGRTQTTIFEQYVEDSVKWSFTTFITTQYAAIENSDGRVYVTKELKIFLQLYAENLWLWSDKCYVGMQNYTTPEDLGYSATQDSLWLYACGWYE